MPLPSFPLAQASPWDQADAAPAPVQQHQLTFSDLKSGLREYSSGESKYNANHSGLLGLVAAVVVVCAFLHFRHRRKHAGPPDSDLRLARELCKLARLSLLTRALLKWVSRSAGIPVAALLVSSAAFTSAIAAWSARPTFGPLRRWGKSHLLALHPKLFA